MICFFHKKDVLKFYIITMDFSVYLFYVFVFNMWFGFLSLLRHFVDLYLGLKLNFKLPVLDFFFSSLRIFWVIFFLIIQFPHSVKSYRVFCFSLSGYANLCSKQLTYERLMSSTFTLFLDSTKFLRVHFPLLLTYILLLCILLF